ncbi:MAG: TonB-dependent receptor [Woeseiaceae bacterium]|nr:TonB-dependent receptor [Woeseiaceae bacterium]
MTSRLFVLCVTFLVVNPSFAQSSDDGDSAVDNILVTGSRSPLSRINVGSSTTVITRDQIERKQARYVTDLLRAVPGFAISQSGTFGSLTQVRVRGAEANHVLVLIDGVRANDPASGDEFRWEFLSTSNVERIEIVRGPQSSLWGSDAVAAVVNVITRSGDERNDVSAYVESGSYDTLNGGLQGGNAGGNWSLAYGLERLGTGGSNVSRTGDELDDSDMTSASLSGVYRPTGNLTIDMGLRSVDAWSQFDSTDFVVTGLPADSDVATDARQIYAQFGARLETLQHKLVQHLNLRFLDTENSNLTNHVVDSSTASDRYSVSYQADIALNENLLSVAAEHERTRFEQRGEVTFGNPNQDQETSVNSLMADFQGRSSGPVTWLLSGRFDNYSDFDDAVTGRLALAWELSDTTRLRGSIGTGQKAPTFIERYGFYPDQFLGNPGLKPETSTSVDLGLDRAFLGDALALQLTLFRQDLRDEINGFVFDPDTFLFTAENLPGKSARSGIEFAAAFRTGGMVEVGGTYTYTDTTEEDDQGQDVQEIRRPRHTGNLYANLRFMDDRFNVLLNADYGGEQDDVFFPPFPEPSAIVTLDSYWLLGLTASWDISRAFTVFARGSNLLDETYEEIYGYRTPGRAGYLGMRVRFGG